MTKKNLTKGSLSIHTENIFPIIKKWLYSEHDIFLRELISNAIDAMNKRKVMQEDLNQEELKIHLKLNKKEKTLQIIDYGIGMTAEEIEKYINQIAFSGAEDFVEKFKDKQEAIIGHFGLGFYSSFMVSEKVTIDSLSYKENSEPAYWECDGSTEYELGKGTRKKPGTTITVYFNEDSKEYLEDSKIKELVKKYSNFMPFPIYVNEEKEAVNQTEALWNRKPKDVTEEEYKEFYKKLFNEWEDPLFWIHLNVDFPFNLKGILYFPKIKNEIDLNKGNVKLFCNNVFVAENLKEFIPEFLLLLKGGIDIPDIPLNVSRSFLQNDSQVKKITGYIIKKVSDHLKSIFNDDRKKYESFWEDIHQFIKYGILTDEKFSEALKDIIIFKTTNDDYVSIEEYKNRNASDEKPVKIFYAPSEDTQISYINMMKEQGIEVIFAESILDVHLFQHLETKLSDTTFIRVDSEINDNLVEKTDISPEEEINIKEIFDTTLNTKIETGFTKDSFKEFTKKYPQATEHLTKYIRDENDMKYIKPYELSSEIREKIGKDAFKELIEKSATNVTTDIKPLKIDSIAAMIVFNEHMRRFSEMNAMASNSDFDMLSNHTLVLNPNNKTIKKIIEMKEQNKTEQAKILVNYIHQLAMLEQKRFTGKELKSFLENANNVLNLI